VQIIAWIDQKVETLLGLCLKIYVYLLNWKLLNWSYHNHTSPLLTCISACAVRTVWFKAEIYH